MSGSADDTIFALSSGAPPAAIAIVRVSGPCADAVAARLAAPLPAPRRAALRRIVDGDGALIDEGLVLRFPAGGSATGEPLVEFHVHGGRAVVARLLDVLAAEAGLRLAEPGEFSRRALLNGRLDLTRAEGLADLLLAETERDRRAAARAFDGSLGEEIEGWRRAVLALSAQAEALVDYADEGDMPAELVEGALRDELSVIAGRLRAASAGPDRESLRDGLSVVIAGPPNAGKSSLLNTLARRDAAIVSSVAGTTRDVIEVPVTIGGRRYRLSDTAGLRETVDPVEAIGIDRAQRAMAGADLMLWLGDEEPPAMAVPILALHARSDARAPRPGRLSVSVLTGEGVEAVVEWLAGHGAVGAEAGPALSRRQATTVRDLAEELDLAAAQRDLLLLAEHLRRGRDLLDRLTGRHGIEDLFDDLFGRFCLGK